MAAAQTKSAIVTGASSGIGRELAHVLAREGHDLTIAAREPVRLETVAQELRELGVAVEAVATNVANEDDIVRLVQRHRDRHGSLDVLVNNAGTGIRGPIEGYETKHMDLLIAVNLRAVMIAYREAMDLLKTAANRRGKAIVINMSSISGKVGTPELSVYSATKHAVVGFTDSMNRELYPAGIRSCVLCPGFVDTPLSDYAKAYVPARDMLSTSDIGEAVRMLLQLSPACVIPEIAFMQGEALGHQRIPLRSDGDAVSSEDDGFAIASRHE